MLIARLTGWWALDWARPDATPRAMLAIPLYDDNPQTRTPIMTGALIAACAAVFLWQAGLTPKAANNAALSFGMVPSVLFGHAALDRKSTRLNSSHATLSRMPSSA